MLIGTTETILDDHGRIMLSLKWRAELASGAIITRGFDKCLFIFPQDQFNKIALEVGQQNLALSVVRTFARQLSMLAEYAKPDNRGRINIPQNLCQFAELSNEVVVVGIVNCLEVWNPKRFAEINSQVEENAISIAEKYGEMIIRYPTRKDN